MNERRLFLASCISLIVTAMHFGIRSDVLGAWQADFILSKETVGWITIGGLWGFTAAMLVGGILCDIIGMGRLMWVAFVGHLVGSLVIIFAPSPLVLTVGIWIIGLANGFVEAAINPLVATLYPRNKTHKLNVLHAWFPGGIVIGGLLAFAVTQIYSRTGYDLSTPELIPRGILKASWQIKVALTLPLTVIYGFLLLGQKFPATERVQAGVSAGDMFKSIFHPLFIVIWVCMWLTAASELGPASWIPNLLSEAGLKGSILFLVYITGLMAVLRLFAGPLVHRLSPIGLLLACSVFTAVGLFFLGVFSEPVPLLIVSTIFAVGVAFYWPTMLGITSERFPQGGALLLAIMGGTGMLSAGLAVPNMGMINDRYTIGEIEATRPAVASALRSDEVGADFIPILQDPAQMTIIVGISERQTPTELQELIALAETPADHAALRERLGPTAKELKDPVRTVHFIDEVREAGGTVVELDAEVLADEVKNARSVGSAMTFRWTALLPVVLFVVFLFIFLRDKKLGGYRAVELGSKQESTPK